MRLNEWQLAFENYLLGEPSALPATLDGSLIGGPTLDVAGGLQIYHNAYRARLVEVLRQDFPTLLNWLGDYDFAHVAEAYLAANPSRHFNLRWLGKRFDGFLAQYLVPEQSPPFVELARLEWAFTLAFDAAQTEPALTLDAMAALTPEEWPTLRIAPVASLQWVNTAHNSLAMWQAVKGGQEFPDSDLLTHPQCCLVWRMGNTCHYRSLAQDELKALRGMFEEGWDFARLCVETGLPDEPPVQAVQWLKQWITDGMARRA